jgi:phospholipid/cholesterol/gamma-HCH transport system substrate-binding protein
MEDRAMAQSVEARAKLLFAALVVAIAAAAGAWYLLAAAGVDRYEIRSRESVSGLIAGAPVEFHGVEVGQVREVRLSDPRSVRILVDLRRGTPISSATVATVTGRGLAARGFTGYVYVSLEDSDAPQAPLATAPGEPYPLIAAAPARSVSLDTSITQLNQSVESVTALLQSALDPRTVASLKESLAALQQVTRTLAANNDRLGIIIANAERASAQVPPLLQSSKATVQTLQTQVLPQAQATLGQLDRLTADTDEAVRYLQTQTLPQAQRTVTRLDDLGASLNDTATRLRRNPSILLRGDATPPGPGEAR